MSHGYRIVPCYPTVRRFVKAAKSSVFPLDIRLARQKAVLMVFKHPGGPLMVSACVCASRSLSNRKRKPHIIDYQNCYSAFCKQTIKILDGQKSIHKNLNTLRRYEQLASKVAKTRDLEILLVRTSSLLLWRNSLASFVSRVGQHVGCNHVSRVNSQRMSW